MIIAVDFDGTVVEGNYPRIGRDIGATPWLHRWVDAGAKLVIFTMRSGEQLQDAVDWYEEHGIPVHGVQATPTQHEWTESPKAHAHIYVDDRAYGIPLVDGHVDWEIVGPEIEVTLLNRRHKGGVLRR